jgi:hypothetical protein
LVAIYVANTDVEITPIIAATFVKDIERFALIELRNKAE